ncbi:MAG: carboxylate--amine ligase, partial [Candidatus Competibacteraceae bacterium]|nr:carboxylate--amine ligase [Candidatus Competibacteraceae bacterium]
TYRIDDWPGLEHFCATKPPVDYFMEGFIHGRIVTFDGLTDQNGNIVFHTSLEYSRNIMDVVNEDDHVYYWSARYLDEHLAEAGFNSVARFDIREKFFHFEFFRTDDGTLVALEINLRPPGGFTTDMFNYANDFDIYREWANVVVKNRFESPWNRPYHCMYIGRKRRFAYHHSHEEIMGRYGHLMAWTTDMPPIFARAMGDYAYLARSPDLDQLYELAHFVQARD